MLILFLLFFSLSVSASTYEVSIDCSNFCAFQELENNCHGVAFKETAKNGKIQYHYTHYTDKKDGSCVFQKLLLRKTIKADVAAAYCHCPEDPSIVPEKGKAMSESSKLELIKLKDQILSWTPCAPDPLTMPEPSNDQIPFSPKDVRACKDMKDGYTVLGGCFEGTFFNHCSYYGNTNNYAGPLCYAGDDEKCKDIKKNQDPVTGAWYRNAFQRRFPLSEHGQPLFSRDEFLGIMLYLAKTKDKDAAEKWMRFLANNPKKGFSLPNGSVPFIKVYDICPPLPTKVKPNHISDKEWADMQPDDRCEMRGDSWASMYKVYRHIGFSHKELRKIDKDLFEKMIMWSPIDSLVSLGSIASLPAVGYEMGNQATNILLLRAVGVENAVIDRAAKLADERTGSESPYYHFLAQGNKATEYGVYLIKKYCPSKQPNYVHPPQGGIGTPAAGFFDYAVHYWMGLEGSWQANLPTGHECVGWINLYLGAITE